MTAKIFLTLIAILIGGAVTAQAGTIFKATLSGSQEVPAVTTGGTGIGTVKLNDAGTQATLTLSFSGLSSNQTAAHIHGNAAAGVNAPVLFNIGTIGGTAGTLSPVTINVTPQQVADLRSGLWYFNVHTANNPNGEIRAQISSNAITDFNGDGKTDWSVIRGALPGSQWTWFTRFNGQANFQAQPFGFSIVDVPSPLDYDGDGKDDIAVRRTNGFFYILNSSNGLFRAVFAGGTNASHMVAADYDADGKDDPAVYTTPATTVGAGNWCYVGSLNNPQQTITCIPFGMRYGTQSDQVDDPYPGDFDGDGRADIRVQRRLDTSNTGSTPAIFITQLGANAAVSYDYFGINGDRVLPGDYDGDGKTDICVARGFNIGTTPPTPIQFFIRYTGGQPDETITWGVGPNFNFAQGDYDGDGKDDIALWINGNPLDPQGRFWVRPSSNPGQPIVYPWGTTGDRPAAGYNNR